MLIPMSMVRYTVQLYLVKPGHVVLDRPCWPTVTVVSLMPFAFGSDLHVDPETSNHISNTATNRDVSEALDEVLRTSSSIRPLLSLDDSVFHYQ